eukprot:TRINITY_DN5526_c0_g1_i1.p1 TRINITY_DN5526_c0_g1~~TRINITY_DN5526_c0_g1_i1.p1  ORF type:complete len:241 (+),score=47.95 TRINITY_DN5526_c0_g1_i1:86-808(+)
MSSTEDEENRVIRTRLLYKEAYLKSLTKKFLQFSNAIKTKSEAEWFDAYQGLVRELDVFEFNTSTKVQLLADSCTRQIELYDATVADAEARLERGRAEVAALRDELQREQRNRQNREEYEALAAVVTAYPPKADTTREIQQIDTEIERMMEEASATTEKFELRTRQLQLLLYAINQIEATFNDEKRAADAAAAASKAAPAASVLNPNAAPFVPRSAKSEPQDLPAPEPSKDVEMTDNSPR